MKIVITGSDGFIGRHLVKECERRWHDASIIKVDQTIGIDARWFFREHNDSDIDFAVHCAALTGGIEGTTNNAAMVGAVNAQLDGAYFEWALRNRPLRIVYVSSSCAYPIQLQRFQRNLIESDIHISNYWGVPERTYGWVKLAGEILANSMRQSGLNVSVVRPFAVYGADQDLCHIVPTFLKRALESDSTFEVWGDGTQTHDFIHVDDCVNAILSVIENGVDGPVNIGTGIGTSVDEVADMTMAAIGRIRSIEHNLDKPTGVPYRVADATLLHSFYEPKIAMHEGIYR